MGSKKNRKSAKKQPTPFPWDSSVWDFLPDCETEPKRWLEETDIIAKNNFDPRKPLPHDWDRARPADAEYETNDEPVLREVKEFRAMSCNSHFSMSQHLTRLLVDDDMEEKWKALGREEREKFILLAFQALEKGSRANVWFTHGPEKLYCPEICLDELQKDNGGGYIGLVKQFLLDNNDDPPTQPWILVNERFDEIIGYNDDDTNVLRKMGHETRRLMRTKYISSLVHAVAIHMYGGKMTFIPTGTEHEKTKETLEIMRPWMEMAGVDFKKWAKGEAAIRKEQRLYCMQCHKFEDKDASGKMMVCSRCSAIGRQVRYCSKECQNAAWPGHKKECGRALNPEDVTSDVPTSRKNLPDLRPDIPPPATGYRRSPDLLRQISHLNDAPAKDYVMLEPVPRGGAPDLVGVSLDELPGAATFIVMRNRALSSGDAGALFYIFRVLQRYGAAAGMETQLRSQLKKEYGKPFEDVLTTLRKKGRPRGPDDVSMQDIEQAIEWLKKAGRFKEELVDWERDPKDEPQMLGLQVGPEKDLTAYAGFPKSAMPPSVDLFVAYDPSGKGKAHVDRQNMKLRLTPRSKRAFSTEGPNHDLPEQVTAVFTRPRALLKQIEYLKANPEADYILWGKTDDPQTPYALVLQDMTETLGFLTFRRRVFACGGYDIDSLVYLLMALEPAVRRRKIPKEALLRQLSEEYTPDSVKLANEQIHGKYYHRRDGKKFALGDIPVLKKDVPEVYVKNMVQLKAIGRFPEILDHLADFKVPKLMNLLGPVLK